MILNSDVNLNKAWPYDFKTAWGIDWTLIKAHKSLKICTVMGSFCPKRNNSARKF